MSSISNKARIHTEEEGEKGGLNAPGRHAGAQFSHAHSDALDEEPSDKPTPGHAPGARVAQAVVEGSGEAGQEAKDGEGDAESGPERELALELLAVA